MDSHTPEPWTTGTREAHSTKVLINGAHWEGLASVVVRMVDAREDTPRGQENLKRILVCVNACAGIPTEVLRKLKLGEILQFRQVTAVEIKRDAQCDHDFVLIQSPAASGGKCKKCGAVDG